MTDISRRDFLKVAGTGAATGLLLTTAALMQANPLGLPIGSQTYPHRAMI